MQVRNQDIEIVGEFPYMGHKLKLGKENQNAEIPIEIGISWAATSEVKYLQL